MPVWLLSPKPVLLQPGLFIVRIITGFFLIYHGLEIFNKEIMNGYFGWDTFKNPYGRFLVYAGKASELVAGVLIFTGLLTRLGAIMVIGTFLYIAFFVGHGKIWYEDQHPFLFVLLALMFFFTGPGKFSLDQLIFKNKG